MASLSEALRPATPEHAVGGDTARGALGGPRERLRARRARRRPRGGCLLVASSGGHLLQLLQLKDEWARSDRSWVTFDMPDARSLLRDEDVTYARHPTNRSVRNLGWNLLLALVLCARLRPRAIVTTGAGVAVPFCYVGRLFGARIVYIESFARIHEPSLTGRLVHPVAHRFFVQWPELRHAYPKAEFHGGLF